jgi:transcriptional regulator with XRE-family HTH domain
MSGLQVRRLRERDGLTQQQAARRWKVSQPYLSLMERGRRPVPERLARLFVGTDPNLATALPLQLASKAAGDLPKLLGSLGYAAFEYLADRRALANPAAVVLASLKSPDVSARVTEALPWVLVKFPELDWNWLLAEAKLANVQNRLGYLVSLARQVAETRNDSRGVELLEAGRLQLEEARLAKEDTLGRNLTEAERRHLRQHRPDVAAHWNVLTTLRVEDLRYVS